MLTINLDDIISEHNVRVEVGDVSDLAASIKEHGLLQRIVVAPVDEDDPDTGYVMVAGHRRRAALLLNGETVTQADIFAFDHDGAAAKLIAAQYHENMMRKDLSAYEQAQIAYDLKLENNKQAEVAALMGIDKKRVSSMHKIAKGLSDDGVDPRQATQLSQEALLDVVEADRPERAGEVIQALVEGQAATVWHAEEWVDHEHQVAEFIVELATLQTEWHDMGVTVMTEDPRATSEVDQWNRPIQDRNVQNVERELNIPLVDHLPLPCHRVWTFVPTEAYQSPNVSHWCVDAKSHTPTKSRKPDVVSPTAVKQKQQSERGSTERREVKEAKALRRDKARIFVDGRDKAADRELWALNLALDKWGHDLRKSLLITYNQLADRPVGADYSWYSVKETEFLDERFGAHIEGGDDRARKRFLVKFLYADGYVTPGFGSQHTYDNIDSIEIQEDK